MKKQTFPHIWQAVMAFESGYNLYRRECQNTFIKLENIIEVVQNVNRIYMSTGR